MKTCAARISTGPKYHYVIVRGDLPPGFLVAQAVHAAGESSPSRVETGTNVVVLDARTESALEALAVKIAGAQIPHVVIREPDAPWCGAMTAIGIEPTADLHAIRRLLSSLPLYGRERREERAA